MLLLYIKKKVSQIDYYFEYLITEKAVKNTGDLISNSILTNQKEEV